jgi:RNA-directed DNA polymerase
MPERLAVLWAQYGANGRKTQAQCTGLDCVLCVGTKTPRVWRELDEWLRHRLRVIQLKHWKRPQTIYRELKAMGATQDVAKQVSGNCHRWWRNSAGVIKTVLSIGYLDRLVPRLSKLKLSNRAVRTRMPRGVAGGNRSSPPAMPILLKTQFAG